MDRRITTLVVLLFLSCATYAISRRDITSRYGRPTWRQTVSGGNMVTAEQFTPESGVALTVRYDEKGDVKEIRIAPLGPDTDERGTRYLHIDQAERILSQIVPRKQQPAENQSGTTGACHHVTQASNDTLSITREFSDCAPKGLNITVAWK
jgi:hypothetical protein